MTQIIASGLVIFEKNKLLLSYDYKDEFFKFPGGKVEVGESLKDCALREFEEESGLIASIGERLPTMKLENKPQTGEKIDIYLNHFVGKLVEAVIDFSEFEFNGHKIKWVSLDEIINKKIKVAPNILFLIEKGIFKK